MPEFFLSEVISHVHIFRNERKHHLFNEIFWKKDQIIQTTFKFKGRLGRREGDRHPEQEGNFENCKVQIKTFLKGNIFHFICHVSGWGVDHARDARSDDGHLDQHGRQVKIPFFCNFSKDVSAKLFWKLIPNRFVSSLQNEWGEQICWLWIPTGSSTSPTGCTETWGSTTSPTPGALIAKNVERHLIDVQEPQVDWTDILRRPDPGWRTCQGCRGQGDVRATTGADDDNLSQEGYHHDLALRPDMQEARRLRAPHRCCR